MTKYKMFKKDSGAHPLHLETFILEKPGWEDSVAHISDICVRYPSM